MKICPSNCNPVYEREYVEFPEEWFFCPLCGGELVDSDEHEKALADEQAYEADAELKMEQDAE